MDHVIHSKKEKKLPDSLDFLKAISLIGDHFPGTIVVTDTNLKDPGPHILYANRNFEAMTGYEPEEIIGKNPRFLQGERTNKFHLKKFIRKLSSGHRSQTTIVNYRKNGERYLCDLTAWPVMDENNEIKYFMAIEREVNGGPGRNKKTNTGENWWDEILIS